MLFLITWLHQKLSVEKDVNNYSFTISTKKLSVVSKRNLFWHKLDNHYEMFAQLEYPYVYGTSRLFKTFSSNRFIDCSLFTHWQQSLGGRHRGSDESLWWCCEKSSEVEETSFIFFFCSKLISVWFDVAAKDLTDCTCKNWETEEPEEKPRPRPSMTAGMPHGLKQYTICPSWRPSVHTCTVTAGEEHMLGLTSPDSEK